MIFQHLFSTTIPSKKLTLEEDVYAMVMHLFVHLHLMILIFYNVSVNTTLLVSIVNNVLKDMFKRGNVLNLDIKYLNFIQNISKSTEIYII